MNKPVVFGIVVVIIALAGGGFLLANKNSNNKPTPAATSTMSNMNTSGEESADKSDLGSSSTNQVNIKSFAFNPANITVKVGTTVTWTNNDSATHTVTETDGQNGPNSGNLEPGKSFTFTYDTAGTFKYHCAIHPNMTGTVTVTQ
jgi:plastocyanin